MNTPTTSQEIVSDRVRVFLRTEGRTQEWLCTHLGMSKTTLWRRLNGHEAWTLPELEIVASVLGVGVSDLLADRAA